MRTIKFKGKSKLKGLWNVGDLTHALGMVCIVPKDSFETSHRNLINVDPSSICQFTGFHDKNGKEIYEGDVLRSDIYPFSCAQDGKRDNYFGIVFYDEESASFGIMAAKNPEASVRGISDGVSDYISQEKLKNFEVVGNIHEEEWKQYREYVQTEEEKEAEDD